MGFMYVKGSYVTFAYANVTYVKHITIFVWKHYFYMSK